MVRIAIIGAGAVGCYYGARLARAGNDVTFLMRRDLRAVREHGLDVRSIDGDFRLTDVRAEAEPSAIGEADWVICSLKSTALAEAKQLLTPVVGPRTRILALMNGLGVEDQLSEWFGAPAVFGGMAFVCINRGAPGVIHHLRYGALTVGHACDDAGETETLARLLRDAGLDVTPAPVLRRARWEKLAWNVPFNGLSVAAGGVSTEAIVGDPQLRALAERAMRELIAIANADLAARSANVQLDEEELVTRMFALTDTMGPYATSMALDYLAARPLEIDAILGEPARRAQALGIDAPTVTAIHALVSALDRGTRGALPRLMPGTSPGDAGSGRA